MLTFAADCDADPQIVWALVAHPARWSSWAPPLRGAHGLGEPEVRTGAQGFALLGALPIPGRVIAKQPRRSWTWQAGPLRMRYRVRPQARGCRVALDLEAPFPIESLVRLTYGPLLTIAVHNLARVAAREARGGQRS